MKREQSDEIYALKLLDPLQWVEQGLGLFYAAESLRDRLMSILDDPPADRRVETLGLVNGAMLLLGLSLENAIKGVYIALNPKVVTSDGVDKTSWGGDGGHGIRELAHSVTAVSAAENELLNRLQEHIVWAGRYPIPNKSSRYHGSQHPINLQTFKDSDFLLAKSLLDRLKKELSEG